MVNIEKETRILMNKKTILTIFQSVIIIVILLAIVFALRAPAADLNYFPEDMKGEYIDSNGLPYFSEMDSYYNLRLTDNYITTGHIGDEFVNNSEMDTHRYAPDSQPINYELGIVYVTDFLYNLVNQYGEYTVYEVAFWTGAFVSCLCVIPAYIFARRLTNSYGAIVATVIIALAPNYFAHTFPGFFDTDMFYYIFALFFVFFFMESLRAKHWALKILFAIGSVISIGLFSVSWTGYVFYVAMMGVFVVVYLVLCYVLKIGNGSVDDYSSRLSWFVHQKDLWSIVLIAVIAFIGLGILRGFSGVAGIFGQVIGLLNLQSSAAIVGGFPNVLVSVAEMQKPALIGSGMDAAFLANTNGVVNGIGGILVLFAGLFILYTFVRRLWELRSAKPKSQIKLNKKPEKSKRKSSAAKLDDKHKFKLNLKNLDEFSSYDEISRSKHVTLLYTTLFIVWTLISIAAVTQGSRFITTLVLPFGLMAGIFVGHVVDYLKTKKISDKWLFALIVIAGILAGYPFTTVIGLFGYVIIAAFIILGAIFIYGVKNNESKSTTKVPIKKYIAIIAIVIALISPTVCGAYQISNQVVPGTSDSMWDSMVWIKDNTPENTVVTSWWDFGYLFEISSDRQVTFDGGSQTGERAFWLGKAMTTDNLQLSAGIFRMLDTTGDKAVEALNEVTNNNGKTTSILCEILPMTKEDAKNTLVNNYKLNNAQADNVTQYTHPDNPRPVIFVASSDMLQKAGWWSYFGSWNFDNQSSENYQYLVPDRQVDVAPGQTVHFTILEEQDIQYNIVISRGAGNNTTTAYTEALYNGEPLKINDTDYNPLNISKMIVFEDGYLTKNESVGDVKNANYTLYLMGEGNTYTPILMSNELENAMFTRLYLEGGINQDIFTQVHMDNGVSLWQVNFNNTVAGGASPATNSDT